jgi:hypothetical protein
MKYQDVKKDTKIKIAETVIFPAVTYGSESWTVRKRKGKKLMSLSYGRGEEFYEFRGHRKATILRLKLRYFGHVLRAEGSLERDIMFGQVAGYRRQGKRRMRWLDSIKEATGLRLDALKEAAQDWKKWRMLVEKDSE